MPKPTSKPFGRARLKGNKVASGGAPCAICSHPKAAEYLRDVIRGILAGEGNASYPQMTEWLNADVGTRLTRHVVPKHLRDHEPLWRQVSARRAA